MSFLAELGFLFFMLSCNSWMLGCALASLWKTVWELDGLGRGFEPSVVPVVRGQRVPRQWHDREVLINYFSAQFRVLG